jgi:hypothetical protein
MIAHLKKLSLAPGDVIVVRDAETLHFLAHTPPMVGFNVPVVFSPQGIEKLNKQDLLNLLEQLEQTAVSPLESSRAPL